MCISYSFTQQKKNPKKPHVRTSENNSLKTKTKKPPLNIAWCPHPDLNPVLTVPHNILYNASLYPWVVILHYYVMIFMSWAHHTAVWALYVFHAIDPASVSSGPFGWGLMTEAELIPQRNTHCTLLCREKTLMRPLKECHTGVSLDVASGSSSPLSHTHTCTHARPALQTYAQKCAQMLSALLRLHTFIVEHVQSHTCTCTVGAPHSRGHSNRHPAIWRPCPGGRKQ